MERKPPGDTAAPAEKPEPGSGAATRPQATGSADVAAALARAKFPIVGIGASAGGLEALEALTKRLFADGMAFVVLQHLAPGHESALTTILARGATLKVVTVEDGARIEPDHIYVAPPGVEVVLDEGVLRLIPTAPDERGARHSIDAFLRSLAADQGPMAIGVILSGAGADGTLGLKAIREAGGISFVQDPSTAGQPSMPQSAIDAGGVDFCLSPDAIADELMRLSKHPYVAATRPPNVFDASVSSKLFVLLRGAFGVDFSTYKPPTIERRIQRRMVLHKLDRLEDYLEYLQANAAELAILYSDLLIGVTVFFRDQEPFEVLKSRVFPQLLENRSPELAIRVWVAGCATGEEAFSMAICLLEYLGDRADSYRIQIFATDIEEKSLVRARLAVYPQQIEADVSHERLQRFFVRTDKGYQVQRAVRDTVVFARHNLAKDPPFSRIDLVSCRNVLIYMQPALQKQILRIFHYSLKAGGFLFLGTSESVGDGSDLFSIVERKAKVYAKKDTVRNAAFDLALVARTETVLPTARLAAQRPVFSVLQLADRKVLEQYGPPGVVVNQAFEILQYRGKTGRFFEPTPGIASINLLKLARQELLPELRACLQRALAGNIRVLSNPIRAWQDNELLTIRLDVTPLPDMEAVRKTFVVLFIEERREPLFPDAAPHDANPLDPRVVELERELAGTKEYLQTTTENFQAANEELQSSNEELQSANEELQSANEELETSKEELQSTNEELITLNEELHNRMAQLNVTSDDLQNVFSATSLALVLVGMDLRIRRFSSAAEKLLDLIPADVGRPISYVRSVVKARDLEETVSNAIHTVSATEQRVRLADGSWYSMRITPYRTADHIIRGAVIEFAKAVVAEKDTSLDLRGLASAILASLPEALAVLDDKLRITWANSAFLELFEVGGDALGRPFEDLWGGKTERPEVWKLLEGAAFEGRSFHKVAIAGPFGGPQNQALWLSARKLQQDDDRPALTLLTIEARVDGGSA